MRDRQDQLLGSWGEFRSRRGLVWAMKDESEFGGQIREGQNTGVKGSLESIAGSCPGMADVTCMGQDQALTQLPFSWKACYKSCQWILTKSYLALRV